MAPLTRQSCNWQRIGMVSFFRFVSLRFARLHYRLRRSIAPRSYDVPNWDDDHRLLSSKRKTRSKRRPCSATIVDLLPPAYQLPKHNDFTLADSETERHVAVINAFHPVAIINSTDESFSVTFDSDVHSGTTTYHVDTIVRPAIDTYCDIHMEPVFNCDSAWLQSFRSHCAIPREYCLRTGTPSSSTEPLTGLDFKNHHREIPLLVSTASLQSWSPAAFYLILQNLLDPEVASACHPYVGEDGYQLVCFLWTVMWRVPTQSVSKESWTPTQITFVQCGAPAFPK